VFEEYQDKELKFTGIMVVWGCVCGIIGLIITFLFASSSFFLADVAAEISGIGVAICWIGLSIFNYYRLRRIRLLIFTAISFLLLLWVIKMLWPLSPFKIFIGAIILAFSSLITGLIIVAEKKGEVKPSQGHGNLQ